MAWGELNELPLQARSELREKAEAAFRREEVERKRLQSLHPVDLDELLHQVSMSAAENLRKPIMPRDKVPMAGALAQLSHEPDPTNAALPEVFHAAMRVLFKGTAKYKDMMKLQSEKATYEQGEPLDAAG